jgi:hypothetical protein
MGVEAAKYGQLAVLQYLHGRDCPLTCAVAVTAAQYGHLSCLQYAHEHGCAVDAAVRKEAESGEHRDCLAYLDQHDLGRLPAVSGAARFWSGAAVAPEAAQDWQLGDDYSLGVIFDFD